MGQNPTEPGHPTSLHCLVQHMLDLTQRIFIFLLHSTSLHPMQHKLGEVGIAVSLWIRKLQE